MFEVDVKKCDREEEEEGEGGGEPTLGIYLGLILT